CTAHGVLSGAAKERMPKSQISRLIMSDTIYHTPQSLKPENYFMRLPVADLIGEAIKRVHCDESVSSLFETD
ncbi:phosphoribosylpyrophosphate synthetase, partial [bacterium]|nr:phosphoribosylpyrophosphate synthetase [bacterium]